MYDHTKYPTVRQNILDSLDRYAQEGVPVGDFLFAVLSNNLMESFGRADDENRETLFNICRYVYNELPGLCHGNSYSVGDWLTEKRKEREAGIGAALSSSKLPREL